jgi:hypothetical protein
MIRIVEKHILYVLRKQLKQLNQEATMAAKLTVTAANTKNDIAYPRVGVYDAEKKYKDSFSVDKFIAMVEDKESLVIITAAWTSKTDGSKHNEKTGKISGNTVTITDGPDTRTYAGITDESFNHFYAVAKAIKNGSDTFNSIKMKESEKQQSDKAA